MGFIAKIFNWVKRNKIAALLLLILGYFFFKDTFSTFLAVRPLGLVSRPDFEKKARMPAPEALKAPSVGGVGDIIEPPPSRDYTPQPDVSERLVVKESNLSLLVDDVFGTTKKIIAQVESIGGYMVNSNISNPTEAATGQLTVRIPQTNLDSTLDYIRSLAIKVVSENLRGRDVTDEYVDIEARMATLMRTKAKFEEILDQAVEISDILNIQRELINLQDQIDNLQGRKQYLEQTARMSKVTIYLSTDELALPYAPSEPWRPEVIFKQAVRSLIGNLRRLGTLVIWSVVYSVVWIPLGGVYYLWRRRRRQPPKVDKFQAPTNQQ